MFSLLLFLMLFLDFSSFPVLETERCRLRAMASHDVPQLMRLRSDERVIKYLDRDPMASAAEAEAMVQKINGDLEGANGISWAVCLKGGDTMIGTVGFWRIVKEHQRAEVGYSLLPEYWGMGLMPEVTRCIIRYGFEEMKLHSIEANVNPANAASKRLLEKLGFVQEAYFRENHYYRGKFLDSAIYSLLAPPS